jgi:hypothetical protein
MRGAIPNTWRQDYYTCARLRKKGDESVVTHFEIQRSTRPKASPKCADPPSRLTALCLAFFAPGHDPHAWLLTIATDLLETSHSLYV